MRSRTRTIGKGILFLLPFFVGTTGFYLALQDGLLNAMYRALRLYVTELDCDYAQVTPLIELARWTAPLMSAAAVLTILDHAFGMLRNLRRVFREGAVAVHGDSSNAQYLKEQLGPRAVEGSSRLAWRAGGHVLLFRDDRDMLSYLSKNRQALLRDGHRVYLCTQRIVRENFQSPQLIVSDFPEICARKYWRSFPIRLSRNERVIAVIGFGNYGQQLLTQGLLTNIYGRDVCLQYHVFGDGAAYVSLHAQLGQVASLNEADSRRDSVLFHSEPWYSARETLEAADRVILAMDDDTENLRILNELGTFFLTDDIHVRVEDRTVLEGLWNNAFPFGTQEELCTEQCILDQETMLDAQLIHCRYFRENVCPDRAGCTRESCMDCPAAREDWRRQDLFKVYSNVAQADHIPVKIHMLLGDDYRSITHAGAQAAAVFEKLDNTRQMELAEREHIRWERYHYLNNWTYAPVRDNAKRQHPMLADFSALDPKDQRKDLDAFYNAFALYRDGT